MNSKNDRKSGYGLDLDLLTISRIPNSVFINIIGEVPMG